MSNDNLKRSMNEVHRDGYASQRNYCVTLTEFREKLKRDKTYQKKFNVFVCVCYSYFVVGMNSAQFGPTLLDLQKLANCTFDQASIFFIVHTIGYLVSSITTGLLFEKVSKILQMQVPTVLLSMSVAAIPWCFIYHVMVTVHFLKGFCLGYIDAVSNALLLHLFALEVKTYMQILHFMWSLGAIISPVISAPFLSKPPDISAMVHASDQFNYTTYPKTSGNALNDGTSTYLPEMGIILNTTFPESNNLTWSSVEKSEIYIAYTLVAVVSFLSAIPYVYLLSKSHDDLVANPNDQKEDARNQNISFPLKCVILVIVSSTVALYTGISDTFDAFLTSFTVKHMKWSKLNGSYATSLCFLTFATGRLLGIFVVNLFNQSRLLRFYSCLLLVAFACLIGSSTKYIDAGIWTASAIAGFSMSIFFPQFVSWTEENLFHLDGKMTSLVMTSAMVGVIINPLILSGFMEESPIWFVYLLAGESVMMFLLYNILFYMAQYLKRTRRKPCLEKNIVIQTEAEGPLMSETEF